jgi:hypothetical protein
VELWKWSKGNTRVISSRDVSWRIVIEADKPLHGENTFAQVSSPTYSKADIFQRTRPTRPRPGKATKNSLTDCFGNNPLRYLRFRPDC